MKYGLIGKKLGHSYSKTIHGFLGNNDYELVEIPPDELSGFFSAADFSGINVTIPYKETAASFCVPGRAAKKIGCVNTIVNRDGALYGFNTDYYGFAYAARKAGVSFKGKKVIIFGSGGASKTAAAVAFDSKAAETIIVSRTGKDNYENIHRHADAGVLVNTTPVGMYPNNGESPVGLGVFTRLEAVIDIVYNPLRTRLVLDAIDRGIAASGGLYMLAAQALLAHRLFFGVGDGQDGCGAVIDGSVVTDDCAAADDGIAVDDGAAADDGAVIEELVSKTEKLYMNIVLTGMPGSGKTTIGRELARRMGKGFVDTDAAIELRAGKKVEEIINTCGEGFFRGLEREAVAAAGAMSGMVIATGGGAVLAQENRYALRQNGLILFLDRALDRLATKGRPLSTDLRALYKERLPVYENLCHYRIRLTDNLENDIKNIINTIREAKL
jgi:shikimate dehydrogenase